MEEQLPTEPEKGRPMSWCKAKLTDQQVAAGELISLTNDFEHLFYSLGEPAGMTLFQGARTPAGYTVYFSPGCFSRAAFLIASYSGTPCETPGKDDLTYLGGHTNVSDAWA
jgi:hypothetical protein